MRLGQLRQIIELEKTVRTDDGQIYGRIAFLKAADGVKGYLGAYAPRVPRSDSEAESHLHADVDVRAGAYVLEQSLDALLLLKLGRDLSA